MLHWYCSTTSSSITQGLQFTSYCTLSVLYPVLSSPYFVGVQCMVLQYCNYLRSPPFAVRFATDRYLADVDAKEILTRTSHTHKRG